MKTKLVIFGITGDLSTRKLLPALEQIISTGDFDDLSIVGVSRRQVAINELLTEQVLLQNRTSIYEMDLAKASDYEGLKNYLALEPAEQALMYLAVPPSAAAQIIDLLARAHLNTPNIKLLFEKPFGFDLASAEDLIHRIAQNYDEAQVYRIDHYMAKDVAAEIIKLRTHAELERHPWNNTSVASIDIVASETLDVGHRAEFYEQTGALRDVLQGHLLQLLSLVLMPVPDAYVAEDLPAYRLSALEDIDPVDPKKATRAQYDGYQQQVNNIGSTTETFVSIILTSHNRDWSDVAIRLTTGKNLSEKKTAITIGYTDGTADIFQENTVSTNDQPSAYGRVLIDAINGHKSIFTTTPEIIRAWEIVAPLQQNWQMDNNNLKIYKQGSKLEDLIA